MRFNNELMLLSFLLIIKISSPLPVAIIHGFMQSCRNEKLRILKDYIGYKTTHYSRCIESGGGITDLTSSFLDQAKKACEIISSDYHYDNDFAIVSISQGGIIARYVIEKCKMNGRVKRFISIGGPLAGTHQIPHCLRGVTCHILNSFADWFCYKGYVQNSFGPSGYFRVSNHIDRYNKSKSVLLDVNNQGKKYDENAKIRFSELDKLVLIQYKRDTMITPAQSAHFNELDEKHNLVDMKDTLLYKNDLFGLKTLDEQGKIIKYLIDDEHCQYGWEDINNYVISHLID